MAHSAPLRNALLRDEEGGVTRAYKTLQPSWRLRQPANRPDTMNSAFRFSHRLTVASEPEEELQGDAPPLAAGINLVKCAVGAGSFSLPAAWKAAGFYASLGLTIALGALATTTACMLTSVERRLSREAGRRLTYPELLIAAFPGRGGAALHAACVGGIVFTSVGVCVAYVDFIVDVLVPLSDCSQLEAMLLLAPIVACLALLRSFKYLAFTSVLGDVAVLAGLIGTVVFGLQQGASFTPPSELPAIHPAALPQSAGNIAFLFLIHVVVLPIAQSMRVPPRAATPAPGNLEAGATTPPTRPGFGIVAVPSYFLITVLNALFAASCYCLYGEETQPNVLQNLASGSAGVVTIQALLCVDLLFTIPMILAAGREIVEGYVMATGCGERHETLTRTATRLALVAAVFVVAAAIPSFGDAVSLIGGLANALMGLILPPLLFSPARPSAAHLITALGAVLLVSSTYFTLEGMLAPPNITAV